MDGAADFQISSYSFHVTIAVLRTDGTLWTWGDNAYGRLGDGTRQDRADPVKVMDNVSSISVSGQHAVAVKTDGTLWKLSRNPEKLFEGVCIPASAVLPTVSSDDLTALCSTTTGPTPSSIRAEYTTSPPI